MGMSSTRKASSSSRDRRSPSSADSKSLTPQRKHRKMLKDGTSEVWPEAVEKVFVEGLREYWESPWATYSRGRSRWRNQFLVDHLGKAGIARSKKQVASHIQVLRNMWKGEPEYQLVAGGEELFEENGLLAQKTESPQPLLNAPSPSSSEVVVKEEQKDVQTPLTPDTPSDESKSSFDKEFNAHLTSLLDFPTVGSSPQTYLTSLPLPEHHRDARRRPIKVESLPLPAPFHVSAPVNPGYISSSLPTPHFLRTSSVTAVSLWAEGMHPLTVDIGRYTTPSHLESRAVSIRFRLSLSSLNDVASPPTLHGFQGSISLAEPWTSSAQCFTRVYAGGVLEEEEAGSLMPGMSSVAQPFTALLPESWLSRCKWRRAGVDTRIIQDIFIDNEAAACIIYDLERPGHGPPSAELLEVYNKDRGRPLSAPHSAPQAFPQSTGHCWTMLTIFYLFLCAITYSLHHITVVSCAIPLYN
ncbi:hypothetical protein FA95DRAFT_1417045 [Auriscalpium vulgare]|uniref:Uncharacterized protein n=1 Tax=Auriscalpium vulgare TaxID=40419 RepID=A0ACB8RQ05_9AGAM|nr:hypothetical protein FA95DRAFT_1417045 [Auriscalpium vulgare]